MLDRQQKFASNFGIEVPKRLNDFYKKYFKDNSLPPTGFKFESVPYCIEVQYFLDVFDSKNYDTKNRLCSFAITTDGHELVVDLNTEALKVLQNEFGDIDELGITIGDLIDAQTYQL